MSEEPKDGQLTYSAMMSAMVRLEQAKEAAIEAAKVWCQHNEGLSGPGKALVAAIDRVIEREEEFKAFGFRPLGEGCKHEDE